MGQLTSKEAAKDKRLRATYNETLDEYNAKLSEQKNACAICERPFNSYQPYQDHDHDCCPRRLKKFCGKCNRGLLCYICNKWAVGLLERMAKQGVDMAKAITYVQRWTEIIKAKGGYAPKEKPKAKRRRPSKKQKSVR